MFIIGGGLPKKHIGICRDEYGEVEINIQYALSNPDVYNFLGSVDINRDRIYYFSFIE